MNITKEQLEKLLVEPGHLTQDQLEDVTRIAEEQKVSPLNIIVEKGYISDEHLGKTIADGFDYAFVDLPKEKINKDVLAIIPEAVARHQHAICYREDENVVFIATSRPDNYEFIKLLEKKTGKHIDVAYATDFGVEFMFHYYKSDLATRVKRLLKDLENDSNNDTAIIELVDLFMEYAHDNGASDIHIEPLDTTALVRFRIDGVLHEIVSYPKAIHEKIIFRIKIMSRLRTDEHEATQDGRFDFKTESSKFDVRVSIAPTTSGENVVMRLLAESSRRIRLEDLGLSPVDMEKVRRAAQKPYGMILSVGPTGSGKTTSLYAILQTLNRPEVNIMTIEDPVEFEVSHVQQIPVNTKKNVTFSTGLRAIVRQDPDIVMVGEIRDAETANIAVNAAMTGHLLLSTLHANDASTTFPRLIDLEVEPFLVASSVNVVMAQRLVRKICDKCRTSYLLSNDEIAMINNNPEIKKRIEDLSGGKELSSIRLYRGKKCNDCNNTGYTGRVGIFEIFEIGPELRSLITKKASADVIQDQARSMGMQSMASDGIEKVFQGITTLEEVLRATKS